MIPLIPSFFLPILFIAVLVNGNNHSIYGILKDHGLPMGLLPKGITRFDFDNTGRFEVHLDQACNAQFESLLHYDMNVSGTLSYGKIGELSGISAQELFLWFQVKGVWVDVPSSGVIHFDVGLVYKQYPLSMFETPKDCMAVGDSAVADSIRDGKLLAEAIAKRQSANLQYEIDQESLGRNQIVSPYANSTWLLSAYGDGQRGENGRLGSHRLGWFALWRWKHLVDDFSILQNEPSLDLFGKLNFVPSFKNTLLFCMLVVDFSFAFPLDMALQIARHCEA
ncbi:hypothetical protein V6N12_058705 [Hibiscus sabdariffa]|uniref:FAD/NAD(P)-binding domain-containing protein n=1 Tax=Hibiscus sabdariffa TaxID=183260 RepID=A0ABR2ETF2_9ROSI